MSVRFSILTPVFNREKYVAQAMNSVLTQTFQDFEVVAVDDGSTDRSPEILASYGDRMKFVRQPNRGPEVARDKAASLARGEYLVFLDSDDYFFPFALETFDKVIRYFDSPPLVLANMVFPDTYENVNPATQKSAPIEAFKYDDFLSKTASVSTSCIIIRRSVFEAIGGLRKDSTPQTFHADDTNLVLKAGTQSPCIVIDKPCTVVYRKHSGNSMKNFKAIADGIVRLADAQRRGEYPGGKKARTYIGGRAASFAYGKCWREGARKLAVSLVIRTAPLVLAALWNTTRRRFQEPPKRIVLPAEGHA